LSREVPQGSRLFRNHLAGLLHGQHLMSTLSDAREQAEEARRLIKSGRDPSELPEAAREKVAAARPVARRPPEAPSQAIFASTSGLVLESVSFIARHHPCLPRHRSVAGATKAKRPDNVRCRASCRVPGLRGAQQSHATEFAATSTADGASFGTVSMVLTLTVVNANRTSAASSPRRR